MNVASTGLPVPYVSVRCHLTSYGWRSSPVQTSPSHRVIIRDGPFVVRGSMTLDETYCSYPETVASDKVVVYCEHVGGGLRR